MPQVIVLDTHIWFWFVTQEQGRYPATWRDQIAAADHVGVSPVSCFELALARQRGRLSLPCEPNDWFSQALEPSGIELLPVTPVIATTAVGLSRIHKDPFDRLIIATALDYGGLLASVDTLVSGYPELAGRLLVSP